MLQVKGWWCPMGGSRRCMASIWRCQMADGQRDRLQRAGKTTLLNAISGLCARKAVHRSRRSATSLGGHLTVAAGIVQVRRVASVSSLTVDEN